MCWSLEVTLAFAAAETLALLALVGRARRYDRANAFLILPLVLQEWLQVILWMHIGETATECDGTNQAASAWVAYVVCAVPAWISLQPLLGAPHELSDEHRQMCRSFVAMAILCGLCGALVQLLGSSFRWMSSVCTYVGPWHHQIWPVMNIQYNIFPGFLGSLIGKVLSAGNLLLYMICSIGGFLAHRPSYVLPAMVGLSAELLILVLGPEWGSFWCFQASGLSFVALLEPWLFESLGEPNLMQALMGGQGCGDPNMSCDFQSNKWFQSTRSASQASGFTRLGPGAWWPFFRPKHAPGERGPTSLPTERLRSDGLRCAPRPRSRLRGRRETARWRRRRWGRRKRKTLWCRPRASKFSLQIYRASERTFCVWDVFEGWKLPVVAV
ncbi:unnamed protein product [Durusdinium trenchii]|uniref:Uncharacterized protein n=1 Tax=Durusdinium trenchii TaxID=1381693 RepID=A0ABP0RMQ9_9DINO